MCVCVCVCVYCANNNQIKFLTRMYNTCTCSYEHQHTLHKKKMMFYSHTKMSYITSQCFTGITVITKKLSTTSI